MTGRALIVMMAFLFSACATTPSQIPQLPKVKMEGNRLVEPDYGYSVQIPNGWKLLDESYLKKFPAANQKGISQNLNRHAIESGLRAFFLDASKGVGVAIFAQGTTFKTKEDLITSWRQGRQDSMNEMNNRLGIEHIYNLEFNRFRNLTDLNTSYESVDGAKYLSYLVVYSFKQYLYGIMLSFFAHQSEFDSYLPLFYECVNSLSVSGRTVRPQAQESGKTANERLEELKRLKEKSLITDEEYEKKKKQILDEL